MVLINQTVFFFILTCAAVATSGNTAVSEWLLDADSKLNTLPQMVLRKIMQLALQPCMLQLYHVDSGTLIKLSDGN